jgi:hypothetical protein
MDVAARERRQASVPAIEAAALCPSVVCLLNMGWRELD